MYKKMDMPHSNILGAQDQGDSSSDTESVSSLHVERKKRKPLMEKKRRARINASLEQLKKLVLDAMKKDSARYSKLEKADILELTVRHLRESQHHQMNAAIVHDSSVAGRYKTGFSECASEVSRYLATIDGLSHDVRMRLMQHLSNCVHKVEVSSAKMAAATHMAAASHLLHPANSQAPTAAHPHHHGLQQPLQIQIPIATSSTSLPGSNYSNRCSPEPGNLPPTPPSSADHSFNGSFQFGAHTKSHQYTLMPLQIQGQVAQIKTEIPVSMSSSNLMPLRSSENIAKLPCVQNSHRYSPYERKSNMFAPSRKDVYPVEPAMKDESMWRPW